MIDILFTIIIVSLIIVIVLKDRRYDEHIKTLEGKITRANPEVYWAEKNEGKRPVPNQMGKEDDTEVSLGDIPMMEFTDRNFNIQMEGDSETPAEARAKKEV
jgi:hypothetical protein